MPVRKSTAKARAPQLKTAEQIDEGSTWEPLFTFPDDSGLPLPVLPFDDDRHPRKPDNKRYFDLGSAIAKSGMSREALARSFQSLLAENAQPVAPRWHASEGDIVAGIVGGTLPGNVTDNVGGSVFGGVVCQRLHDLVIVESHDGKRHEAFRPSEVVLILPEARVKLQDSAGNRTRTDIGSVRAIARRSKLQDSAENRGTR